MQSLRDSLPNDFLSQMQSELGREETLRLLWPAIVGSKLGSNTALRSVRQKTLWIAVPDRTWKKTLRSLETMILEAVCRFCGEEIAQAIEWVEEPGKMSPPHDLPPKRKTTRIPLAPADLPLEAIPDPELREMFRLSAQKYFTRQTPFLAATRPAPSKPEGKPGTGQEIPAR